MMAHCVQVFPTRGPRPVAKFTLIDFTGIYKAEYIMDEKKRTRKQEQLYLVKWQGYPIYESTWETPDNVNALPTNDLIQDWEALTAEQRVTMKRKYAVSCGNTAKTNKYALSCFDLLILKYYQLIVFVCL